MNYRHPVPDASELEGRRWYGRMVRREDLLILISYTGRRLIRSLRKEWWQQIRFCEAKGLLPVFR